jgi:O-antigen/teichoic acid export membrane protein
VVEFLRHARRSHFLRHNSVFFFGAVAVGALNYLYYPILGRLLNTAQFGEVQALISLFLQITIFLSVLGLVTINVVTNYASEAKRNAVILEFEKLAFVLGIGLLAVTILLQGVLARFLQFDSRAPFILLVVALVVSVPLTFRSAFLRGQKRFGLASVTNLLSAGGKLLFAVLLVVVGLKTVGAIGGLVAAQLIAGGFAAAWAARYGLKRRGVGGWLQLPNFRLLKPELRYGLLVLIGSLIITLQYSIDIVVVKHYFDPHTAGLYAGVASVARIVFFLTASVAMVLMSLVKLDAEPTKNRQLLVKSLVLTAIVGLPVVLLSLLEPEKLASLLMGGAYSQVAGLLPKLSLAIFIVAILNVVMAYYLALRQFSLALPLGIGAGITYWLLYSFHASLEAIVNSLLIGSAVMLCAISVWAARRHLKEGV